MSQALHIKIELEIHAITCPGVWLCKNNGDVELSITCLGYTFAGKPLKPRFPLCYHEKFIMDGYFIGVTTVTELEKALDEEQINFTLWQKGRRFAYYVNKIGVILNYTGCLNNNFATTDNAIIMTRGRSFPGTISPKIEYTASMQYMTKCIECNRTVPSERYGDKRITKNLYEKRNCFNETNFVRRKPVCHADSEQRYRWRHIEDVGSTIPCNEKNVFQSNLCDYCLDIRTRNVGNNSHVCHNSIVSKSNSPTMQQANCNHLLFDEFGESIHSENNCLICMKYASIFDNSKKVNE